MSIIYNVKTGDTFESVSRNVYGVETEAARIAAANPGVLEPLTAGLVLTIPALPEAPAVTLSNLAAGAVDEVAVRIDGTRFRFWTEINITRSIDAFDTVELSAPFDHTAATFRDIFRPFTFKRLDVTVGGELLFTGTMFITPKLATDKTVEVRAYALAGVLNDCPLPASVQSEYNAVTLETIAAAVAAPFGVGVQFDDDPGAAFDSVATTPTETVLTFLSGLAKQRGLIISNTPSGGLLFLKSKPPGVPVAVLEQSVPPLRAVTPTFNHQGYFSEITGIEPTRVGQTAGLQFTERNPHARGFVRPFTYNAPDVIGGELKPAVAAKLGRMLGGSASYTIDVSTWRDPGGALWAPGTTVRLTAPDAMIYGAYDFIVESVEFSRGSKSESAALSLVIPGTFSGEIPGALPWDG